MDDPGPISFPVGQIVLISRVLESRPSRSLQGYGQECVEGAGGSVLSARCEAICGDT